MSKDFFSITFLILLFDLIFFENNIIYINNVSVYNFYTTIKNKACNCTAVQRRTAMKLDHLLISGLRKRIDAKFKKSTGRLSAAESSSDMEKKKGNERMLVRFAPSSLFRDSAIKAIRRRNTWRCQADERPAYQHAYLWQVNRVRCPSRWVPLLEKAL